MTENRHSKRVELKNRPKEMRPRSAPSKEHKFKDKINGFILQFSRDIHRVEAPTFSRLLNELSRVAHFKRVEYKDGILTFEAPSKERNEIIALTNNLCYNHTIVSTKGILNGAYSVLKRTGLFVGLFCAICAFMMYPHFIVDVVYTGEHDQKVSDLVSSYGVKKGEFVPQFNGEELERVILGMEGISFASVEKVGTRVRVHVVHEQSPDQYVDLGAGVVVAKKDGTVTRVIVYSGTAEVVAGQSVSAGQTLIGDYYLKGEDKIPSVANGVVYGERTVEFVRFFPDEIFTETGRKTTKTAIGLFRGGKAPKSPYLHYTVVKTVFKNDFLIPFTVYQWTFCEIAEVQNTLSEEEMCSVAYGEILGKNQFEKVLSHSSQITRVEGGYEVKVTLTVEEKL